MNKLNWYGTEYSPEITVNNIKAESGCDVKVKHFRYIRDKNRLYPQGLIKAANHYSLFDNKLQIDPRGGTTEVTLIKDKKQFKGHSICRKNEAWNHKVAISIAGERALSKLGKELVSQAEAAYKKESEFRLG